MNTDMTQGSPASVLWRFSMPMLLSVVFQQLYNIVDSVVAGRFIGEDALAAVGASYPVTMLFMAVATGCNIGCGVIFSQLFGAKELKRLKTAISTSFISVLALAAFLTIVGLAACGPILNALSTPQNIFSDSAVYLNIYILGLLFLFLYNLCNAVFVSFGDSRTPLYFLIGSSVANIIADVVFVVTFKMGVAGVAWATFMCQGAASLLALFAVSKRIKGIKTEPYSRFSSRELARISKIAIPSILQQSFVSVGNLFIQSLVNSFGSAVVAGYSAAVKLNTFALTGFTTLGSSMSSFTAQNIGAGKPQRVKQGFKAGVGMTVGIALVFFGCYFGLSKEMIGIFITTPSGEALEQGVLMLRIISPFYLAVCLKLIADGVLRGAGCMGSFMVATFTDLILRVILAYVFAPSLGALGIWLSWPVGWIIAAILSLTFYFKGGWKTKSMLK